jgi:hypothetical protein
MQCETRYTSAKVKPAILDAVQSPKYLRQRAARVLDVVQRNTLHRERCKKVQLGVLDAVRSPEYIGIVKPGVRDAVKSPKVLGKGYLMQCRVRKYLGQDAARGN